MYNPLSFAEPIESPYPDFPVAYQADPAAVYPVTAEHIKAILDGSAPYPSNLSGEIAAARSLGPAAFDLVNLSPEETPADQADARSQALNICRRFFTEVLHSQSGYERMYLHLLKNERYRLRA